MPARKEIAALFIIMLTAILWVGYGVFQFLSGAGGMPLLLKAALVGVIFIISGFAAYSYRRFGGWILVFEGLIPAAVFIARGNFDPVSMVLISGPPMISGLLFLLE